MGFVQGLGASIGGHDNDHIAEIGFASIVVSQRTMIHHLQQNIKDIRVRFFDLVQQQHRIRMFANRFGQQTALIEADVARRRANQT